MNNSNSTEEFQHQLFDLVGRLLPTDGLRFNIYVPRIHLNQEISSDQIMDVMTKEYGNKYWHCDPMHPSHFEDKDTTVITNSILMTDFSWERTKIYNEFYRPNDVFHNADVFFRKGGRIIAVLSLVRKDPQQRFTDREVALLKKIQPFVEFSLNKVYLPRRIHDRSSMSEKYSFTARELDVVELALTGVSNKIMVKQLKISLPTLRTHLQNIYTKVGVHSSSELISKVLSILK